jgi:hypothetical protein
MADLAATHRSVLSQIDRLLAIAEDPGEFPHARTDVSRWSPLLHAEHLAKAGQGSLGQLEKAIDRDGGPAMKPLGWLVLTLKWIPRGRGEAPKDAVPESAEKEPVAAELRAYRERVEALGDRLDEVAAARGSAGHPFFGGLTPARWLRFLEVHHDHHLKIVADIRTAWRR